MGNKYSFADTMRKPASPTQTIAIMYLIFSSILLSIAMHDYWRVTSKDEAWSKRYSSMLQDARDAWSQYPGYGVPPTSSTPYFDSFWSAHQDLVDPSHDPMMMDSAWHQQWPWYWMSTGAFLWVVTACFLLTPGATKAVIVSPAHSAVFLGKRAGEVKKDDWFKTALIVAIILAAIIVAMAIYWKRD